MSKKMLVLLIAALLILVVPIATYARVQYVWAQNSLGRARLEIRSLNEKLERGDSPDALKEAWRQAEFQVRQAAQKRTWIKREDIDGLEHDLAECRQVLDRTASR